jgi:hypothetical protein
MGRFDPFGVSSGNGRYLRIPAIASESLVYQFDGSVERRSAMNENSFVQKEGRRRTNGPMLFS